MAGTLEDALAEFRDDPTDEDRFEAVEAAMKGEGDWRELVRFYTEHARTFADEIPNYWRRLVEALEAIGNDTAEIQERSRLLVATGDLWDERLDRADQAILVYQAAFKVWPQNPEALDRARALYRREEVWRMVARLYDLQLKVTAEPNAQAELYCDLAQLRREQMDDRDGARAAWQKALDAVPGFPRAESGLADLERNVSSTDLEALLRAAEDADEASGAAAHVAVARHLLDHPEDDHDPAAYLHAALAIDPDDTAARRLYRRVLREAGRDDELADAIAEHAVGIESTAERAELLVERADVLARLERTDEAADALLEALTASPDHAGALARAPEIFGAAGRHADAVAALERSLDFGGTAQLRLDRARTAGEIAWWTLDDLERAAPFFQRVRLADASNETMLRFFVAWWESQDDTAHLVDAMHDLAAVVDPEQAGELRVRLARLIEAKLDDPTRAADAWTDVLRARPDMDEAHEGLRRNLYAAEAWNRLVDQLKHDLDRASNAPVEDRVALHLQLAALYSEQLEVPALAVKAYNDALALDPTHDEALQRLAAHYARVDRWRDHVDVVLRRVDASSDDDQRIELLEHVATICRDELDDAEGASTALERIVEIRPSDTAHRAELGALHAARHDFAALAALKLDEAAELEGDAQIEHLKAAVEALDEAEPEDRRGLLEALVGVTGATDPGSIDALGEVYEDLDETDAHIALLERAIDAADALEPERGMEVAALCERAGRPDEALDWWRRVLDAHPTHEASRARVLADAFARADVDALVALAEQTEAYGDVVEALSAVGEGDDDGAMAALTAAADLAAAHLDVDVERDLRARISEKAPDAVDNLERRIELAEDLHERAALLEAAIEASGPVEATAAVDALVALCVDQLEQPSRAWMHAAARFEAAPTPVHLDAVEAITEAAGQGEALVAVLAAAETDDAAARRAIDRALVKYALAADETIALAADAADRLCADGDAPSDAIDEAIAARIDIATRRRDADALVEAWDARIARADADEHEALTEQRDAAREALLRAGDDPATLAAWLVERAADESGDARVATWLEAAAIHTDLDDGADEAIALYQAVLSDVPDHSGALEALEDLLRASDDPMGLAGVFERQATAWGDDRGVDALLALAAVQRDALDDPGASADALRRAAERGADAGAVYAGYEALYAGDLDDELRAELRDRLEPLVRDAGDDERLAELLTERLAGASSDDLRALHDELATLATARGDADAALAHRRLIVSDGHVDDGAVDALVAAAAAAGDWMSAIGTLEAAVETAEGTARAALLDRVAMLQADALDDVDEALELRMRAARESADADARRERLVATGAWLDGLDDDPTPAALTAARIAIVDAADGAEDATEAAVTSARATDDVARLAATLETVLDRMGEDADAALRLKRTLAELYLDDLGDADEGEVWLRGVLDDAPDDEEAWMRLDGVLLEAERWDDLAAALETRIAGADEGARLGLLQRLASVHEGREDAAAAADAWSRVVALDESDTIARAAWRGALEQLGDHEGRLARLVADRDADPDAAPELDAERARLLAGPLDRRADALELVQTLVDDGHGERVAGVLGVLVNSDDEAVAEAARAVRLDLVAASGDPLDLARALMTDAEQADDADVEAELLERAAGVIADASGTPARDLRFELALRWLVVRPASPQARAYLVEASATPDQWSSAVYAMEVAVEATTDVSARVELLRAAAQMRQDEMGDADAAADTWRMLLAIAPTDADAFEAFERLLEKAHRYDELALLLVEQGEGAEDDEAAVELLTRAARIHEMRTRDHDAAVEALDGAIRRGGGADLRRERARLLRRQSRWDDLADAMADDAGQLEGDEAVAAWVQIGTLRRDKLEDLDGAVAAWREALGVDPGAASPLGALGRLVREASRSDEAPSAAAAEAARALLDGAPDASMADAAWSVRVAAGDEGAALALARHRTEAHAPPTRVAEAWWAALPAAIGDEGARTESRVWATEHHQLDGWREAIRDAALGATDPEVACAALLELADVAAEADDDLTASIEALQLAHRVAPDAPGPRVALEAALDAAGRSDDLADLLEEQLAEASDDDRAEVRDRLVAAALAADDPHRALAVIEQAIDEDGPTRARLEQLESVARDADDTDRLVAALRGQVELAETAEARRDARMALGGVLRDEVGDADAAVEVFAAAVNDAPTDIALLQALIDLHRQRGDTRAVIDALDAQSAAIGDPAVKAEADAEIATMLIDELDAPEDAWPRLVAVIAHDPAHDEAAGRLVELAVQPDLADDVLAAADPVLREAERWHDLVELWRIAGAAEDDPAVLRDRATVAAEHAADIDQALVWRSTALIADPRTDEIDPLVQLGETAGALPRVVEAFAAAADESSDADVSVALLRACASIEADRLDDAAGASRWLAKVVELAPDDVDALRAVAEHHETAGAWDDLVASLDRLADVVPTDEQGAVRMRMAEVLAGPADRPFEALEAWRDAMTDDATRGDAILAAMSLLADDRVAEEAAELLEPALREPGREDALATVLAARLDAAGDDDDVARIADELVDLYAGPLDDADLAMTFATRALEADRSNPARIARLGGLAGDDAGRQARALAALVDAADEIDDADVRLLARRRAAELAEALDDVDTLDAQQRAIVADDPRDDAAWSAVRARLAADDRADEAYAWVVLRADALDDPAAAAALWRDAADLASGPLGEPARAVAALEEAVERAPSMDLFEELEMLERQQGDVDAAAIWIERRADFAVADADARVAALRDLARLHTVESDDVGRAIEAWERVLAEGPDAHATDALRGLYADAERFDDLLPLLQGEVDAATGDEQIAILHRIAEVARDRLDDPATAADAWRRVLDADPSDASAWDGLAPTLVADEAWREFVDRALARAPGLDEDARAALALEAAERALGALDDPGLAEQALAHCGDGNGRAEVVRARILRARGDLDGARAALEQAVGDLDDPHATADAFVALAELAGADGGEPEAATAYLEAALEQVPDHAAALDALDAAYTSARNGWGLLSLIDRRMAVAADDAIVDLLLRKAMVASDWMDDPDEAADALEKAWARDDSRVDVGTQLVDALLAAERVADGGRILDQLIPSAEASSARDVLPTLYEQRARLAEARGDQRAALADYERVFAIDARRVPSLVALGRLRHATGDLDGALKALQAAHVNQSTVKDKTIKRDLFFVFGQIREARGEADRAKDMYRRARSADRDFAPATEALERLK